jgi:monoterpene epsilon-lactone hydrolase
MNPSTPIHPESPRESVKNDTPINTSRIRINGKYYDYFSTPDSPPGQIILYIHGDQRITNFSQDQQLALAMHLSRITQKRVFPLNPFLNTVHPFPDALMNTKAVYTELFSMGYPANNIIIGADSTAGNLVVALMLILKDKGIRLPKALFLFSPWLDLTLSGESLNTNAKVDTVLSKDQLMHWAIHYYGESDPRNPYISPINSPGRFFPPLLIQVGANELLLSDSVNFAAKLGAFGCPIELSVWEEMQHGWHIHFETMNEASKALQTVGEFVTKVMPQKR